MDQTKYDVFISYKRKSLPTANNLYYRLTTRGYSTFFDLEEMRRDNFNTQLLNYIENAKDVFVILEEGSLDACKTSGWEKDWFCHEIAFALEKKKNIIPILLGDYKMPPEDFFPDELKELSLKNAPEFNFSFFEAYLDKLIEKDYLISKPNLQEKTTSVFKFYSNENCQVFKEGKLVCSLEGRSDEPYYLPVPRKGDYRFKVVNLITSDSQMLKERIDADEEKEIEITWKERKPFESNLDWQEKAIVNGDKFVVDLGVLKFNMIRVKGGTFTMGASIEQGSDADDDEKPIHQVTLSDYYLGEVLVTQELWQIIMGNNPSSFIAPSYPVENVSWDDCHQFINKLNEKTGLLFRLPTEAEWEFAARGGKSGGYKFSGRNNIEDVAWYDGNSGGRSHSVKTKCPNELGIFDMSGNVWEWCQDWKCDYNGINHQRAVNESNRVLRGGSWRSNVRHCRVSFRGYEKQTNRGNNIGFRLALSSK